MSRQEMSPYSDVEFAFLIEDPNHKDYFRKLSRLLEIKITNLGETRFEIIRPQKIGKHTLSPQSLSPRGFSMDIGGLSPLGKEGVYELIGTPEELASYQSEGWLEHNTSELILANAMRAPSLLIGNEGLLKTYQQKVRIELDKKIGKWSLSAPFNDANEKRALDLLKGHVTEFGPSLCEEKIDLRAFDAKKELYRPFQMIIESLSIYYQITGETTVERIEEMERKKLITLEGAKNLKKAFEMASILRLRTQFFYKEEKETMLHIEDEKDKCYFPITTHELQCILEIYRVLLPLHRAALDFLPSDSGSSSSSVSQLVELSRTELFGKKMLPYLVLAALKWELENFFSPKDTAVIFSESLFYDERIASREKRYSNTADEARLIQAAAINPTADAFQDLARIEVALKKRDEALKYYSKAHAKLNHKYGGVPNEETANCLNCLGQTYQEFDELEAATKYYEQAKDMLKQVFKDEPRLNIAISLSNLATIFCLPGIIRSVALFVGGFSLTHLKDDPYFSSGAKKAIEYHEEALKIRWQLFGRQFYDTLVGRIPLLSSSICNIILDQLIRNGVESISQCIFHEQPDYYKAIPLINLTLASIFSDHVPTDIIISLINLGFTGHELVALGVAHEILGERKKAVTYYNQFIEIRKLIFGNRPHVLTAFVFLRLGCLHLYSEPLLTKKYFEEFQEMNKLLFGKVVDEKDFEERFMNACLKFFHGRSHNSNDQKQV